MRYSILAAASLGLLAAACTDSREPTAPPAAIPSAAMITPSVTCPATSPVQQINTVIALVQQQPSIPDAVKRLITTRLQTALAALQAGHTATAITQLTALRTRISTLNLPAAAKAALIARIDCILATLRR